MCPLGRNATRLGASTSVKGGPLRNGVHTVAAGRNTATCPTAGRLIFASLGHDEVVAILDGFHYWEEEEMEFLG